MHKEPIIITADDYSSELRTPGFSTAAHPLGLLRTCKQISNESTALFYGNNSFRFEFISDQADEHKDELCLVQRFCASIGETALVGLRNLHVHVGRKSEIGYLIYDEGIYRVHSRNLLGLQGVSVLNENLSIKYTLESHMLDIHRPEKVKMVIEYVAEAIRIEDLKSTLCLVIASLQNHEGTFNSHTIMRDRIRSELQHFQKTTFGPKRTPADSWQSWMAWG